jgi:hypothetical protein
MLKQQELIEEKKKEMEEKDHKRKEVKYKIYIL